MLLQQIVGTLDAELERLLKLREIVVKLGRSRSLLERVQAQILSSVDTTNAAVDESIPKRKQTKTEPRFAERRAYRPRVQHVAEPSAFAKAIPAGPVVVSAQQLHDRKQKTVAAPETPEVVEIPQQKPEAPDRLVRDLSQRWLSSR